jgi:hypothetical protein
VTSHRALTVLARDGFGELALSRHYPESPASGRGWITIDHADPRILLTTDMAHSIACGEYQPFAKAYTAGLTGDCLRGGKLEIRAENGRLIYVLTEHMLELDCYVAEWPD